VEVVMPVVFRGEHVATVFCGQAVTRGCPAENPRWFRARVLELGLDPDRMLAALRKLPRISEKKLVQIGKLLFLALSNLAETESRAALDRALALERARPIRESLAYVEGHFREPIGIRELSQHVHLTPAYLSRLFHKAMGMTFSDYLTERRIAGAKDLLKNTSMKMSDVAFEIGYSHQSYFGRKFRQFTGVSPLQFRKANQPIG
jgi:AraC-like DNA-binding protein